MSDWIDFRTSAIINDFQKVSGQILVMLTKCSWKKDKQVALLADLILIS